MACIGISRDTVDKLRQMDTLYSKTKFTTSGEQAKQYNIVT